MTTDNVTRLAPDLEAMAQAGEQKLNSPQPTAAYQFSPTDRGLSWACLWRTADSVMPGRFMDLVSLEPPEKFEGSHVRWVVEVKLAGLASVFRPFNRTLGGWAAAADYEVWNTLVGRFDTTGDADVAVALARREYLKQQGG